MIMETITIPMELYKSLLKKEEFLEALENYGVDNWSNYGDAYEEVYGE